MSGYLLEAVGLDIGFPNKTIGRNIQLTLSPGEILCLLGPNGSGKSTLFRTLLGLQKPLAGRIQVQGRPLSTWSTRDLAGHLAYVPQAVSHEQALSAEEMVVLGRAAHLSLFSIPSRQDLEAARSALDALGMSQLAAHPYPTLSGGEKQLVLIARALAQQPAALIMDEPTASLDFGNQVRVLKQMKALATRGIGILFCTHQPEHALRIADRVLLFRAGQLHADGPPDRLLTNERLAWLYDLAPEDLLSNGADSWK